MTNRHINCFPSLGQTAIKLFFLCIIISLISDVSGQLNPVWLNPAGPLAWGAGNTVGHPICLRQWCLEENLEEAENEDTN